MPRSGGFSESPNRPPPVPPVPVTGGEGDAGDAPSPVDGNDNP